MGIRSERSGRLVNEFINKTVMLRKNVNRLFDRVEVKATNLRTDIWEKEASKH